jgi:hypothetical protein
MRIIRGLFRARNPLFFQIVDDAIDDGGKLRQAFGYHAPEHRGFDALVFVTQDVADAADRVPLDLWVIRR